MARQAIGQLHDWSKSDWGSIHSILALPWDDTAWTCDISRVMTYSFSARILQVGTEKSWQPMCPVVLSTSHPWLVAVLEQGNIPRMRWVTFEMIGDRRGKHPPMVGNSMMALTHPHFVEVRLWPLVCTAHWIQTTCSAGSGQICGLLFKATEEVQCKIGNVLLIQQFRHGSINP